MTQQQKITAKSRLLDVVMKMMGYASTSRSRKLIKEGYVKVDGKLVTFPPTEVHEGSSVQIVDRSLRASAGADAKLPFTIHHDDEHTLVIEKPSGIPTASPDRKRKTAFSVTKAWLAQHQPEIEELYFVNKLPKEASGLVIIAKDAVTRTRLQRDWNKLTKRYYVLAKGEFPDDGEIGRRSKNKKDEDQYVFPFRKMKQGRYYALLRIEMKKEAFSELFSLLEMNETPVPGYSRRGKSKNPIDGIGFHFFSVDVPQGVKGEGTVTIKTPVPRSFLNLVKSNNL
jgi:23S rRNA-/tRNA-specific pseudouridylate synthase